MIDQLETPLRLALPKGRMQLELQRLLADAGLRVEESARAYRPRMSVPGFEVKLLKPRNVVEMLAAGSRDLGFAGADWIRELDLDLVELFDTELDPVQIVAAAPAGLLADGPRALLARPGLRVASEYAQLTRRWLETAGADARVIPTFGATEVFPPEDADCIVDNTASGATLSANGLEAFDTLMTSSTRLYANPHALEDEGRRAAIDAFTLMLRSVVDARRRVMLDLNVTPERLDAVVTELPAMRRPTVGRLHGDDGFAVRAAVPSAELALLVPRLKAAGATDVVVTRLEQIVP